MNLKRSAAVVGALVLLIVLGWMFFNYSNRLARAENQLEAQYQMAFFSLLKHSENLDMLLAKSIASSSPRQNIINLTTVWHEAENARMALDRLPVGLKLQTSQKYLAQIGDFAFYLAKKNASNQAINDAEWNKLKELRDQTRKLNIKLHDLIPEVKTGKIKWGSLDSESSKDKAKPPERSLGGELGKIDERLKDEAPTLTYDGPFSDHVESIKPKGLTGPWISESKARGIARGFIDVSDKANYSIKKEDEPKGLIPAYSYTLRSQSKKEEVVIDVSKKGGHVVWYLNPRDVKEAGVSIADAISKAEGFLRDRGFNNMIATGSLREDNVLTVTFVPLINGVVIYPDFIKVSVALDNEQIVGYNAQGYLIYHHKRDLPQPKLTKAKVKELIKPDLDIKRIRLALIPTPSRKELLCYEVRATLEEDEEFYIYINAANGHEERILKIIETGDGNYTM